MAEHLETMAFTGTSGSNYQIGLALLTTEMNHELREVSAECVPSLPEPRLTSELDKRTFDHAANLIRVFGDRLNEDVEIQDMIDGLEPVILSIGFSKLAEKVFEDGHINWGRIMLMFYVAGKLAVKMVNACLPDAVMDIFRWAADFYKTKLLSWVCSMGGWVNCIPALVRDGVSVSPASTSGLVLVFLSGVLLGSFIAWRLSKNN